MIFTMQTQWSDIHIYLCYHVSQSLTHHVAVQLMFDNVQKDPP